MATTTINRSGFEQARISEDEGMDQQQQEESAATNINKTIQPVECNDGVLFQDDDESHHPHHHGSNRKIPVPRLFRLFRYDNSNNKPPEATALALDVCARATILMSSIFLGPALLELAMQAVEINCNNQYDNGSWPEQDQEETHQACIDDGRVYGFRPTSILSNIAIVAGLVASAAMPVFGAFVDHTTYRWHVGAISSIGLVVVKGVEACVSLQTWFLVAGLQVVSSVLFQMHITTTYAYTSELSTDQTEQTYYNTSYTVLLYISSLIFLAFVTAMSFLLDQNDIGTARISQITTSSVSLVVFYFAWKYFFRDRPALRAIPEGQTLLTVGFCKAYSTFGRIIRELPPLKWLIFAVMFGEAATATLITIGTTYMKSFLEMDANDIGLVMLACLATGAPGSKLGAWISYRIGPVYSAAICNCFLILVTTIAAATLTGPEHSKYMPLIGGLWGVGLGWQLPMHSTAFITISPRGQEAESMGLYILSGQILSWLPPMLFTFINEVGMEMSYGLASLDFFFAAAIVCLLMVRHEDRKELLQTSDDGGALTSEEFVEMQEMPNGSHEDTGSPRRRGSHSKLEIT